MGWTSVTGGCLHCSVTHWTLLPPVPVLWQAPTAAAWTPPSLIVKTWHLPKIWLSGGCLLPGIAAKAATKRCYTVCATVKAFDSKPFSSLSCVCTCWMCVSVWFSLFGGYFYPSMHSSVHTPLLIQGRFLVASGSTWYSRPSSPQWCFPAPPARSQGASWPDGISLYSSGFTPGPRLVEHAWKNSTFIRCWNHLPSTCLTAESESPVHLCTILTC